MTPRREIVLSALLFLAACGAAASSAPGDGVSTTIGTVPGVGVLPSGAPESLDSYVAPTTTGAEPTSTVAPDAVGQIATSNRLIVLGDSLTASVSKRYGGQLCDVLVPAGWQVEIDAETSRFIEFGQQVLKSRASDGWGAAVVFLGNNYDGDQPDYATRLDDIVGKLGDIPVVVLTVTEYRPMQREVNDAIRLVARQRPNMRVLDWKALTEADGARILGPDGLHLTDHGRQALADAMGLALGPAPAQPGGCLRSNFTDDSEGSVTGTTTTVKRSSSSKPTSTTVKPSSTTTTVKSGSTTTTATTVKPGSTTTTTTVKSGVTTTTIKSAGSTTTDGTTASTTPPTPAPTTPPTPAPTPPPTPAPTTPPATTPTTA